MRRWSLAVVLILGLVSPSLFGPVARAQDTTDPPTKLPPVNPIAIVTCASIERFLVDIDWTFETAGRPELTDFVAGQLGNINDLKGIDRNKPFGILLFLAPGLPPRPVPVAFVPVTDIEELIKTVGLGPMKMTPVEGQTDRYELKGPRRTGSIMVQDGFAFVTTEKGFFEDQEIANPIPLVAPLAARYDISVNLRIREIPSTIRDVVVGMLRTTFAAEMQQRDEEPDSIYKMRKANGTSLLEFLTNILDQGDQFLLGWDASKENRSAVLEWQIDAVPGSGFSKYLKEVAGKPTTFHAMLNDSHPLTIAGSWTMDKREKKAAAEGMEGLVVELNKALNDNMYTDVIHPGLKKIYDVVQASIEDGHIDLCIQMIALEKGKFGLVGGARVAGAETLAVGIREILDELRTRHDVKGIELDTDTHLNIGFHHLTPPGVSDGEKRMYGGQPSGWIGAGGRNFWFCFGTPEVFTALTQTIDLVQSSGPPTATTPSAPFQVVFRMAPWLQIPPDEDEDSAEREMAQDSFSAQDDAARLTVRPTDTGLRTRIQLDEGFVRWVGRSLAQQIDEMEVP